MIIPWGLLRSRRLLFAALLGLALSPPAQADALLDHAQSLVEQGDAEQAFDCWASKSWRAPAIQPLTQPWAAPRMLRVNIPEL
jgi:hypothetical protein